MRGLKARLVALIVVVLLGASSLFSPLAMAASGNTNGAFDLVVSPVSRDLEVKPGGSVSAVIQVKNQGIATEHLKISLMSFGAQGESGTPQLISPGPGDNFLKWASFSSTHFDAQPNVWTPVTVTIRPPASAAFGYYYAVVFSRDTTAPGNKTLNQVGAVASLILLDVQAPGAVRQANIIQFSTAHHVSEFLPETFTVRMHNSGNVHVAPRGNIFITRGDKNVGLIEVNPGEGNILPKTNRAFTAQWTDGTPVYRAKTSAGKVVESQGQPVMTLDWSNFNLSKLRIGKYDAKLVMVYNDGDGDVSTQATLSFWVIPWRILIGLLIIGLLVLAGLWALLLRPMRRYLSRRRGEKGTGGGGGNVHPL